LAFDDDDGTGTVSVSFVYVFLHMQKSSHIQGSRMSLTKLPGWCRLNASLSARDLRKRLMPHDFRMRQKDFRVKALVTETVFT